MTEMVETECDWKKGIQVYKGLLFPDEPSKTKEESALSDTYSSFPGSPDSIQGYIAQA